jgi:hypothetical protein
MRTVLPAALPGATATAAAAGPAESDAFAADAFLTGREAFAGLAEVAFLVAITYFMYFELTDEV